MSEKFSPSPMFLSFANQEIPRFVEVKDKEWIYYGEKNDYPYYLLDLYTRSAYNNAIINGKAQYIAGNGWTYKKLGLTYEQQAIASNMLKQPYGDDDLNGLVKKVTLDYEIFNGFAIAVTWSKNGKTATLQHYDFCNIRANADGDKFYYTKRWAFYDRKGVRVMNKAPQDEKDFTVFDKYDPENRTGTQLYYFRAYHPDQYVYPIPVYAGAVIWVEVNVALSDYHYNNIKNGFVPSHIINFYNGEPEQSKQQEIEQKIREKFQGEKGLRWIINFAQSKDTAADVNVLQMSDIDKQYQQVALDAQQQIFTAHGVTSPMLFGIKTEGQLGGRTELIIAEEQFQNGYINIRQKDIECAFNELAKDMGISIDLELKKRQSISWMPDDATIVSVFTKDELRKMVIDKLGGDLGIMQFAKQEDKKPVNIKLFEKFGVNEADYEVMNERDLDKFSFEAVRESEDEFKKFCFATATTVTLTSNDRAILDLLNKDNLMPIENLAKVCKISIDACQKLVDSLQKQGYLKPTKQNGQPAFEVTAEGTALLDEVGAKTEQYEVMYKYQLAVNAPELVKGGHSREFCVKMTGMNKLYTREDIEAISDIEDRNVWEMRGGWYHNPKSDVNVPHCRHIWSQKMVKKK